MDVVDRENNDKTICRPVLETLVKKPQLYVKSKRTNVITGHVSVQAIGPVNTTQEYVEGSVLTKLSAQDSHAKVLLERSGVDFETVDLSNGIVSRLKARIRGVKHTPTLWDPDNIHKSYVGIEEISKYIIEKRLSSESRKG